MNRLAWGAGALVLGMVLGAGGLRIVEALTVDRDLVLQRSELVRLSAELKVKETALAASQARVTEEAVQIRSELGRIGDLADQVLTSQGTAVERLKRTIAVVRQIRDELRALPVN